MNSVGEFEELPLVRTLVFVSNLRTHRAYVLELTHYQASWVRLCHGETMGDYRSVKWQQSALYKEEVRANLKWLAGFLIRHPPLYDTSLGTCELPEGPFDLIVHVGE